MITKEQQEKSIILLEAVKQILDKTNTSYYVDSFFNFTAIYDDAECDGYCLYEDIKYLLEPNHV
jgi:hypothetical protein